MKVIGSLAMALMVSSASGAIVGNVNLTNSSGLGITLSSTGVDFLPAGGGVGGFTTGVGSNMTYAVGTVLSGEAGTAADFSFGSLPVPGFLTFAPHPGLLLDLDTVGPGVVNTVAVNSFDPNSAPSSPSAGSPYIMQATATGTVISFSVSGIGHDNSTPDSLWSGVFSTQIVGVTPFDVQQTLVGGGTVSSTWSASIIGSGIIPEPAMGSMVLLGLLPLARRRRR